MSGATIPYHLRQNKAIDRNLFIEALVRVGRWRNISDYSYIGFGGPFLEDFKQIHGSLRISDMTSLELSDNVVVRQRFNAPVSGINLTTDSSGAFLMKHEFERPSVVWFDYTSPADLAVQLSELELLIRKLRSGDVARITVNCDPETLGRPPRQQDDLLIFRLAKAKERMADYCPADVNTDSVTRKNYSNTVLQAISIAAKRGMDTKADAHLEPLACFSYADGQQMLSVTMIVVQKQEIEAFNSQTRFAHWPHKAADWNDLRQISVPQLSSKERMSIESMLPATADANAIWENLGFYVGNDKEEAIALMQNFLRYYRLYPWYSRVVL